MPYRHDTLPSYREHKATGQAIVTLDGRDFYLGKYRTPESRAKYERLMREYVNHGFRMALLDERENLTVACLCDRYLRFAQREYVAPDGMPTGTVENTRLALRALFEFAADLPAESFGPRLLGELRQKLIESGLARTTVNYRVAIVKRAFKWAAENELVPASVWHGLTAVRGLRRGRGGAHETDPVSPAPEPDVRAATLFLPDPVRAMVELQLLTGARPNEIVSMRSADIDRCGPVWVYAPRKHKNAWRGQERRIYLGPKAQAILAPFLLGGPAEAFLFSPRLSELRRRDALRRARRTPLYPSHVRALERKRKSVPKRQPRDRYDVMSYRQAITRACRKAGVPPWTPNRLRHNAATRLRAEFGLDVAKAVLGHRRVETTQIYAEADLQRAMEAMQRAG